MSVIVPTRNSAATLEACLRSIAAQDWPDIETIVVDNGSTDATLEIARRLASQVLCEGAERSAQRNAGARRATGAPLLMLDADMVLQGPVLSACVAAMGGGADAIVVPEISVADGFWGRCRAFERDLYDGEPGLQAPRAFRPAAFRHVGGFDESLSAFEDWDLGLRLRAAGYALARLPGTEARIVHSEGAPTLSQYAWKKAYYRSYLPAYAARHPAAAAEQTSLLARARVLARHPRTLLAHPRLTAGLIALKATELLAMMVLRPRRERVYPGGGGPEPRSRDD